MTRTASAPHCDVYPPSSIPRDHLVDGAAQPDYLPGRRDVGAHANVGRSLSDEQIAAGRGDLLAAVHAESGRGYTFQELAQLSTSLAAGLVKAGLRPGDRLAFRGPNTPETLAVVVAAWKAGAVVVPTPAQARADELAYLLSDSGARFLMAHPQDGALATVDDAVLHTDVESVIAYAEVPTPPSHRSWSELDGDPGTATLCREGTAMLPP